VLAVRDAQPSSRVVVGATDDHLVVLNLTHPALTPAARNALLGMARPGAVVGSVVGFLLGFFLAYDGHMIPAVAVGVAVPIAAGTLGYLAGGRPVLDVIYQAPD
jgi:hypothetical protein